MDITQETQQQSQQRLRSVLHAANVAWLPGHFAFTETANPEVAVSASRRALAVIRGENRWSVLDEADEKSPEKFRFHLPLRRTYPEQRFRGLACL